MTRVIYMHYNYIKYIYTHISYIIATMKHQLLSTARFIKKGPNQKYCFSGWGDKESKNIPLGTGN